MKSWFLVPRRHFDAPFQGAVWFWRDQQFRGASSVEVLKDDLYPDARYAKSASTTLLPNGQGPYCTLVFVQTSLSMTAHSRR